MASIECTIQVHVRRTGEMVSLKVIPMVTTFENILQRICQQIGESEPSHYYIAMNYESEMEDAMVFEPRHVNQRFQLIMRTRWLLEYIAEQTMQRKRLKSENKDVPNEEGPVVEPLPVSPRPATTDPSDPISTTSENKVILRDVVRSTIKKIPRQDVQTYLHQSLGKSFDILLMGSPRVGKSTLINAILKKDIAQTSAGRNACTATMTYYEYEETYTSSADDISSKASNCSIRIWDAPGIEDWSEFDVKKHIQTLVEEKNPICLIYCVSPGSYADVGHMKTIIEECKKLDVFVALVVTNMYASDESDDILEEFKTLLAHYSQQTKVVDKVFHFGTVGLCTEVNSVEYVSDGVKMNPAGVDELMVGIMNSLSEEKLLQWCFALMDNGPFWIRVQSRIWKAFDYVKNWVGY